LLSISIFLLKSNRVQVESNKLIPFDLDGNPKKKNFLQIRAVNNPFEIESYVVIKSTVHVFAKME
jgi:hypothetical protein